MQMGILHCLFSCHFGQKWSILNNSMYMAFCNYYLKWTADLIDRMVSCELLVSGWVKPIINISYFSWLADFMTWNFLPYRYSSSILIIWTVRKQLGVKMELMMHVIKHVWTVNRISSSNIPHNMSNKVHYTDRYIFGLHMCEVFKKFHLKSERMREKAHGHLSNELMFKEKTGSGLKYLPIDVVLIMGMGKVPKFKW